MERVIQSASQTNIRRKIWECIPCRIVLIISGFILGLLLVSIILINPLLNSILKPELVEIINRSKGHNIGINSLSFSFFNNSISFSGNEYSFQDEDIKLQVYIPEISVTGIPWLSLWQGGSMRFSEVILSNPDIHLTELKGNKDNEEEKQNIFDQLRDIIPEENQPLEVAALDIRDGTFRNRKFNSNEDDYFKSINLNIREIYVHNSESSESLPLQLANSITMNVEDIFWRFPEKGYDLKIKSANLSSLDSSFSFSGFSFKSFKDKLEFFEGRKFRSNKIDIDIKKLSAEGFDMSELLQSNEISVNLIDVNSAALEFLTDKRVPRDPGIIPRMPHELISSLDYKLNIHKITLNKSEVFVKELWSDTLESYLAFTQLQSMIHNLSSTASVKNPVVINTTALLADAGEIKVEMKLPLNVKELQFEYEGSLGGMSVIPLNPHLRVADKSELVSGTIGSVTFKVKCQGDSVNAGIIPVYNNLKIKTLTTESTEGGLFQDIKSFFANTFKIRESNPDEDGEIVSGNVVYIKDKGDYFLDVVWFSIRDALGEVVGF